MKALNGSEESHLSLKAALRSTLKAFKCSLTTELVNKRSVKGQQIESSHLLQVNKGVLLQPVPPSLLKTHRNHASGN